jgi:hypothetical protein
MCDCGYILYLTPNSVGWDGLPLEVVCGYLLAWVDTEVDVGIVVEQWNLITYFIPQCTAGSLPLEFLPDVYIPSWCLLPRGAVQERQQLLGGGLDWTGLVHRVALLC